MSGVTRKGPERPAKEEAAADTSPLYNNSGMNMEGKWPKIVMIILCIILAVMFIIAFSFCVASGVQNQQPRYFLLLVNIVLSTSVSGLLIFWYYRGTLKSMMLWYVFVQCFFLLFQFITTDIFAWYEPSINPTPTTPSPWEPITNCTTFNNSNGCSNATSKPPIYGPAYEEKWLVF